MIGEVGFKSATLAGRIKGSSALIVAPGPSLLHPLRLLTAMEKWMNGAAAVGG